MVYEQEINIVDDVLIFDNLCPLFRYHLQAHNAPKDIVLHGELDHTLCRTYVPNCTGVLFAIGFRRKGNYTLFESPFIMCGRRNDILFSIGVHRVSTLFLKSFYSENYNV